LRILLLAHGFNGLTQRLFVELRAAGHAVSLELDIADAVTEEAVQGWQPDVVLAPFLKRRIPESVWSQRICLVVHPGPPGDGGPHALDWAIERGLADWGVTVLQAVHDYDAGPVWAWRPVRPRTDAGKGSLYRREVSDAAVAAVFDALARWRPGACAPQPAPALPATRGHWQAPMPLAQRAVDWARDDTATVLRRLRAADGSPGVPDTWFDRPVRLFDGHAASAADLAQAPPGALVARRGPALLHRTRDGGVWIGHVRALGCRGEPPGPKLAATRVFAAEAAALPALAVPLQRDAATWDELRYRRDGAVGTLSFDFHNGALSVRQACRLVAALAEVAADDARVLVLDGGADFFCNGIHLHDIEADGLAGGSAADASMAAIEAIDDVALAILQLEGKLTVAALRGNAGAGGCFLALAADALWLHRGVVLNPHYRNMGNLHGSEYWTYLLPRRVGEARARAIARGRLPMGAAEALDLGLADAVLADDAAAFDPAVAQVARALADAPDFAARLAAKAARRRADEAVKPLAAYRAEELARMRENFYGFDPSYHVARHHFVHRKPHAWTPRHLALHR
jgi:putative two-component system hydrogenase maturation factor HypX/HoxX